VNFCYIDAFSGLAGDMLVGALADAGADRAAISTALNSLGTEAALRFERVKRRGMAAEKFHVDIPNVPSKHRHLSGILKMIDAGDLSPRAKTTAERIFQVLAEAESAAHGVAIEKVHFHEVGAVDSICDIVGIAVALDLLSVTEVGCSAINVGSGTVKTEHGVLPVPAPATAALLKGWPIYARGPATELTTPTGAAVVAALGTGGASIPAMTVNSIGYGAGDKDFPEHANLVRVMIGRRSGATESTTVTVIEANLDDASPQILGYASEALLAAGALDVVLIPVQMKKGRPGTTMQVITTPEKRESLANLIFRETTSLGVRFYDAQRRVQPRIWVDVVTAHGTARMKTSPTGFAPEYEDCRKLAATAGIPLKQVIAEVTAEYLKKQ